MSTLAKGLAPAQIEKLRAGVRSAREMRRRHVERPLDYYRPLTHGRAFHASTAKERWLVAGNGSGKTEIGAVEVATLVTSDERPGEVWCGSVSLADSEAIQRRTVARYIPPEMIASWPHREDPGSESVLTLTNGWVVRFKATNQGRERWQGGNVSLVWFDEEPDPDVFDEGYARTRMGGRVILTFTPLKGFKWEAGYSRVYKAWLEFKRTHPAARHGEVAPGVEVFTASVTDNPHVPPEEIEAMRRTWAHRPLLLRARLEGEWLNLNAEAIVPMDRLKGHGFTFDSPPSGGWAEVVAWCDPSFSAKSTADRWCISLAGRDITGRVYLIAHDFGRPDTAERVTRTVSFLGAYDFPTCYVQPTNGDREFAARCNEALMAIGARACVTEYGSLVGKVERANSFAVSVGNGQVLVADTLDEFRAEAGAFPNGKHDDVFDAGMGACMSLVDVPNTGRALSETARAAVPRDRDEWVSSYDERDDWRMPSSMDGPD